MTVADLVVALLHRAATDDGDPRGGRRRRLDAAIRFRCDGRGRLTVEATAYRTVAGVRRVRGTTTLVASLDQLEDIVEQALAELENGVS